MPVWLKWPPLGELEGMTMQNAFTSVRPRGADTAPAKAPRKTSKAPAEGNVHLLLDSNGRRTVSLERKTKGGITIESREQSAASLAKTQRIKGAK